MSTSRKRRQMPFQFIIPTVSINYNRLYKHVDEPKTETNAVSIYYTDRFNFLSVFKKGLKDNSYVYIEWNTQTKPKPSVAVYANNTTTFTAVSRVSTATEEWYVWNVLTQSQPILLRHVRRVRVQTTNRISL